MSDEIRIIGGRYHVIRPLGRGAFGRTLLCTDSQTGRSVAVKELHFGTVEDWKHLELFEREADVLSRLDHPGIPAVLDFFHDGDEAKTLCIVQEFVEGTSLQQRIDAGPMLGQAEVREIAGGLLEVLEYLHGRVPPVLHRDIKPSNVLLRRDGRVALVDFGGVWFGWRPPDQAGSTVVGTFGYMPAEQLVGQAVPASDLYALGATLLHTVTGRPPTDFPLDSGRIEVPANVVEDRGLSRMIEALLRPAPRDRPRSAAAARQLLEGGPVLRSASTAVRVRPRHPDLRAQSAMRRGYGPRFVDLGPPPRDPKGEFRDVYSNLLNPLFPARRTWSAGVHIAWTAFAAVASAVTFGVVPLIYAATVRERRRAYADLFRDGEFTHGVILSVDKGTTFATFRYEIEVAGDVYVGTMEYAQELTRFWGQAEVVPVLYDRDDPNHSCFVYR